MSTYQEWFHTSCGLRKRLKIAVRTKDYPATNIGIKECARKEGVSKIYSIQYVKQDMACEIGDWILQVKIDQESERGYYFRWLHIDKILRNTSEKSQHKLLAIQLKKMPAYHSRPFRLTEDVKDAFVAAIKTYMAEEGNELPLNDIISCPDSIITTIAGYLMVPGVQEIAASHLPTENAA